MNCLVTIGKVETQFVTSISTKESFTELANTAVVVLPREYRSAKIAGKTESFERKNIKDLIKVNDTVTIKCGYDDRLQTVFEGYVKKISADIPLRIELEDEMFKLRKSTFKESFKQIKLLELLQKIAPGYEYDVIDNINLGKFIIENSSAFEVLSALRKDYLMYASFKGKKLIVGFPVDFKPQKTHVFNVDYMRSSSSLEFVSKEELKLEIKAISNNSDGTKEVVTVGESGGSSRTLNFANKSKTELEDLAKKSLESLNFDGYEGSFDAIGEPFVSVGDAVIIKDNNYPNSQREGKYLVESVERTFEPGGYKQTIKLSLKL
jgi:ribosomal protein S17